MIRGVGIINNSRRAVATEAVARTRPALAPFLGGATPTAAAPARVVEPICAFSGAKLSSGVGVGAKLPGASPTPKYCGFSGARLFSTCGFSGQSLPDNDGTESLSAIEIKSFVPEFTEITESVDYAGSIAVESEKEFGSADVKEAQKPRWLPHPSEEDATPIIPRWWTGKNAVAESEFVIDAKKIFPHLNSLSEICVDGGLDEIANDGVTRSIKIDTNTREGEVLQKLMAEVYNDVGMVSVRNTGLSTAKEMKAVVKCLTEKEILYEGGANPREALALENVYDTGAPLDAHIHYHHEMAYIQETVANLGFVCLENTNVEKGHTFMADNVKATDMLLNPSFGSTGVGQKLKEKGLCYVRKLPDRQHFLDNPGSTDPSLVYNFWQTSFLTEDPDEAAEIARTTKGLEVEWVDSPIFGRYMVTKHYTDAFEYCPYTDRNLLFSSIADDFMWFDAWKGVQSLPHEERPLKLNYGDNEVMTRAEKQEFADVYDAAGVRLPWAKGDVAVACNIRTAHGRPPIHLEEGEVRQLGVVLGPVMRKQGVRANKWDAPAVRNYGRGDAVWL